MVKRIVFQAWLGLLANVVQTLLHAYSSTYICYIYNYCEQNSTIALTIGLYFCILVAPAETKKFSADYAG